MLSEVKFNLSSLYNSRVTEQSMRWGMEGYPERSGGNTYTVMPSQRLDSHQHEAQSWLLASETGRICHTTSQPPSERPLRSCSWQHLPQSSPGLTVIFPAAEAVKWSSSFKRSWPVRSWNVYGGLGIASFLLPRDAS